MATPVLDLSIYTPAELQTMLTTAKAEYLRRMTDGSVVQGSSAAQSYGMTKMTVDDLVRLMNGISSALGLDAGLATRAAPNFNTRNPPSPLPFGAW